MKGQASCARFNGGPCRKPSLPFDTILVKKSDTLFVLGLSLLRATAHP